MKLGKNDFLMNSGRDYLTILKCENSDDVINFDIVKNYEGN